MAFLWTQNITTKYTLFCCFPKCDFKLFGNQLRSLAEPFEYDKYKREKVKEKLEKEAASRISVKKKMPKVNAKLAARLTMEGPKKKGQSSLLEDERFKSLFENPDFLVDEQDEKYQLYHRGDKVCWTPSQKKKKRI